MPNGLSLCGALLALTLALTLTGTARADTIALIWQDTGSDGITANVSTTVTANIILIVSSTGINGIAWEITWDDELAYVTSSTVAAPNGWNNATGLFAGGSSTGTSPGNQRVYAFDAGSPTGDLNLGVATVGTITFHVTSNVTDISAEGPPGSAAGPGPGPGDVGPGFVNTQGGVGCFLTQGGYCTGSVTVAGASVHLIPEPGTLALLALGAAGLGLVGRRSRS